MALEVHALVQDTYDFDTRLQAVEHDVRAAAEAPIAFAKLVAGAAELGAVGQTLKYVRQGAHIALSLGLAPALARVIPDVVEVRDRVWERA